MKRIIRRILITIAVLIALYLALGMLYLAIANYIYSQEMKLPRHATHAQVRQVFKHFKETRVTYAEVPADARQLAQRAGYAVYRYDLVIRYFAVHVIYDRQDRVARLIETYE